MATDLVTCLLRNRGEVLLERRPADPRAGEWDAITAPMESDGPPEGAARRVVAERTGIDGPELVRTGGSSSVSTDGGQWTVTPVLFDCPDRGGTGADEHGAGSPDQESGSPEREAGSAEEESGRTDREPGGADREWTTPTELLRRESAPWAWRAYERVAPTVRTVAADDEHGSAYISVRALEVLRDRAGLIAAEDRTDEDADGTDDRTNDPDRTDDDPGQSDGDCTRNADRGERATESVPGELRDLARRLREARPRMAALANRINRTMATAGPGASGVETAAVEGIERALAADERAAGSAAERVRNRRVLTLSRSGTVLSALLAGDPAAVFVAESRPAREGVGVAERLAGHTTTVLHTDAAVADVLARRDVDLVLVGADAVGPDGTLVNKTGTRTAATAAANEDLPLYAVAASDKIAPGQVGVEHEAGSAVYDGEAPLEAYNPLFDETPPDLVAGVITERGTLSPADVREVAEEHARLAEWDE